jgi:hypothetical protein
MITYTWRINKIHVKPLLNGLTNVIHTVDWDYIGIDENDNTASIRMPMVLPEPLEVNFIPYNDITEEMVISWLESISNIEELQQDIIDKIEIIKNPPIIELPFPWVNS